MKTKIITILSISAVSLGLNACMMERDEHSTYPNNYKKVSVYTDSRGTTTTKQDTQEVDEDEYGNRKVVNKTTTTKDPKGMFNKTTTSQTKTTQQKY